MEEKLTIAGKEIPSNDWEQTPASVKELIRHLEQRILHIEERLGVTSSNSSQPPSSDPPKPKKENSNQKKKKRGGQKGHKGFGRYLYEPKDCREVIKHQPKHCQHCHTQLRGGLPEGNPYRHQIVEIPPVKLDVVEHQLHALSCPSCGKTTRASLPPEVAHQGYGERLRAIVGLLSGGYRLSHEKVKNLLWEVFSVRMSVGSINRIRKQISESLEESVEEARDYVKKSGITHVDETGWKQHNGDGQNREKKSSWLWVGHSDLVTVYQVSLNRGQKSAKDLLGEDYGGIVISDRYGAYNWIPLEQRQICWAHIKRDLKRISERKGVSGEIGKALLKLQQRLFRWWYKVRDGTLSRPQFEELVVPLRQKFKKLLEEAASWCDSRQEKTPLAKTARTCAALLKVEPALWTYVSHEGVEPTNNSAERSLRTAVIWRKLSFGSQSAQGSEFVARSLTVVQTLRRHGRAVTHLNWDTVATKMVALQDFWNS
ncbi:MAG: IS66 family transposase [Kamptonema sp. SIO4C4]|nr:IS66 family transposase [Kamptonema sp. SIO4C4]